mmetsp:Transcript_54371/g.99987  ORF Transcript_54371/g.99987 Transcript_54371/m.99987 type:complete len:280 (-) Transcript_54371:9-848(-)
MRCCRRRKTWEEQAVERERVLARRLEEADEKLRGAGQRSEALEKQIEALSKRVQFADAERLEAQHWADTQKGQVDELLAEIDQLKRAAQAKAEWEVLAAKTHAREMEALQEDWRERGSALEEELQLAKRAQQELLSERESLLEHGKDQAREHAKRIQELQHELETSAQSQQDQSAELKAALHQVGALARQLESTRAEHREASQKCEMLEEQLERAGEERLEMLHLRIEQMQQNTLQLQSAADIAEQKQRLVWGLQSGSPVNKPRHVGQHVSPGTPELIV